MEWNLGNTLAKWCLVCRVVLMVVVITSVIDVDSCSSLFILFSS